MSTLTGIKCICSQVYIFLIAVYAQICIYLVAILLAVKARLCMFLFLVFFEKKENWKCAFKMMTFVLYWLGSQCSYLLYMVFKGLSFVKCTRWLSYSVLPCSSHNPCLCVNKLKHLTFLSWLQQFGRPKQQFIVFLGSTVSGNSNNVVIKSINFLLLLAANLLLPNNLCTVDLFIFMSRVVPLWECCVLIGSCNILWLIILSLSNLCF